jgi:hypothetical protein
MQSRLRRFPIAGGEVLIDFFTKMFFTKMERC